MSSGHLSKEFFELVKSIGESRSKQEEDQIITREVQTLKAIIKKKKVSNKRMKEYLMRMIYVEMLGHDASFAHIHAVNLTSSADLLEKRVGYLACTLTLHPEHEFMFLMVNTIQQDLRSDNYLHVSMALNVVTKLVSAELIPALLPLVTKSLEHANAQVRKRAVVCVHRMHELQAGVVPDLDDKVRRVLCDADPSVMGASLPLFLDLCREDPASFKDLVPSFVSILKQVTEHRLPRDFDYHRMPAPWIQINLLRILGVLGTADKHASEGMYEILQEVMKRADIGINVGFAIVYESVRTVTQIYPDNELLEAAASCISRFIASENHNLKYLGINALSQIVQINPTYAAEHQLAVIECLEDHDETLKRKTLDLLFAMTNPANVIFIVDKLTKFLESTVDVYLRKELVSRITELAEKYAPDNSWYIQTMNLVFEMGGDLVRPAVAHNLMRLIAENGDDTCDPEDDIRVYAVRTYFDLLAKPQLPDVLLQVIAWVIGEFAYLVDDIENMEFLAVLCDVMERELESTSTRSWFLDAVMKISAYMDPVPPMVDALFRRYQVSHSVDLQQRAHEFIELVKDRETMRAVLPRNASTVEIDIDEDLSFLSTYVDEARANGAPDYEAPDDLEPDETFDYAAGIRAQGPGLKLRNAEDENTAEVLLRAGHREPRSTTMSSAGAAAAGVSVSAPGGPPATATPTTSIGGGQAGLQLRGVKNVWGRKKEEPTPEPAAASSPTNTQAQRPQYDARQPSDDEPAATSQPAREARKRSLTEQEILAQQLFAGVGATAGATRGGRGRRGRGSRTRSGGAATRRTASSRRRQPEPEPEPEPEPVQQQAAQHDFLDFDIDDGDVTHDPNPAPVVHAQPAAAAPVDPLDMLWGADPEPAPSTHSHVSSPSAGSGSIDVLEDIFGDGGGASSAGNGGIDDFAAHVVESRLFAPEVLTTPQFGSKWKATKQEVKLTVSPSSCKTPADYTTRLQEEVHFHAVQTIGIEVICAGRFTADNSLVLVHGKVRSGKGVDVTVRASSKEIAQQALGLIRTALK